MCLELPAPAARPLSWRLFQKPQGGYLAPGLQTALLPGNLGKTPFCDPRAAPFQEALGVTSTFSGFSPIFWVSASAAAGGTAAASPVCKIRQASDWLVPDDAKARDVTPSHPIRRRRRRGQRRTSRRDVFWRGEQLTSSLSQSENGARVAGLGESLGGCCSEAREGQSGLQRALPYSREIWSQPKAGPS